MRRRSFITLLGGAAAAWPLAARAQQAERVRRVAFLHVYAENDPEVLPRIVAFRQGLEALGWTENRNIQVPRPCPSYAYCAGADILISKRFSMRLQPIHSPLSSSTSTNPSPSTSFTSN